VDQFSVIQTQFRRKICVSSNLGLHAKRATAYEARVAKPPEALGASSALRRLKRIGTEARLRLQAEWILTDFTAD
jgi:hypothetical protein